MENSNSYRSVCRIILLALFPVIVSAGIFSPCNRYELAYSLLERYREQMISDSAVAPFLSNVKSSSFSAGHHPTFAFSADKQQIEVNIGAAAGFEHYKKSSRFGILFGDVSYTSEFLDAYIKMDMYSTERRDQSPLSDIQYERFIKTDFNKPIEGMFDFRANLPDAYLQSRYKSLTLVVGKKKLRWGPGYKGTLGLSGTAYSPFYYYDVNLAFGSMLNMEAFLCGYDDESIYRHELTISEKIVITASKEHLRTNFPRYGAGQRLDIRIGQHVQLGIYELVDFFGANEFNRFANPLQVYYLANETSGTNNANLLAGIDFNVIVKPLRVYGEIINDDITVFEQSGNPDKYGLQLGAAFYGTGRLVTTGLEYTHVARYVYGHYRVLSRHGHWGESIGWPWGNNQDVVTGYAVMLLPKGLRARAEANYWLKGNTAIENDWYADGKPDLDKVPFLPENATKAYSATVSLEYAPFTWMTSSLYWEPVIQHQKLTNGVYVYVRCLLPAIQR